MRKRLIAIRFVRLVFLVPAHSTEGRTLILNHLEHHYASFDEVKPVLRNNADTSVYLSTLGQDGFAPLERSSDTLKQFENGNWKLIEPVAGRPIRSIEIKAHSEQEIRVDGQISTDGPQPRHFIVDKTGEERPIAGRYRPLLGYQPEPPEPWTPDFHHKPAYFTISAASTVGN